jgi:hypothetical protein
MEAEPVSKILCYTYIRAISREKKDGRKKEKEGKKERIMHNIHVSLKHNFGFQV